MRATPVRKQIPPHRNCASTQRAQHAQQRSDTDHIAAETHLPTRNDDALLTLSANISATTPASNPSSPFMPEEYEDRSRNSALA